MEMAPGAEVLDANMDENLDYNIQPGH